MKNTLSIMVVCGALALSCATAAMAQPQDHHDRDRHDQDRHDPHAAAHPMYDRGHSEGWYRKGGHVPAEYNRGSYEVADWRANHLRQPPRGYHYVRSDNGDFLLVAVTTGVIASIIAGH
ncbi:RcnB family protein [Rhodanobacter sp. BL-MT-08]